MNLPFVFCFVFFFVAVKTTNPEENVTKKDFFIESPKSGTALDEVVVESSLHIKKKALIRRSRSLQSTTVNDDDDLIREKRHRRRFGPSQSSANAAAQSNFFNPNGDFGSSAANAQAQAFESGRNGKLGSFGASAAGTQTQSFTANHRNGIQGSASASMSQVYHLPNGKTVNFAITNGFSNGPNGQFANSNGNSLTIN